MNTNEAEKKPLAKGLAQLAGTIACIWAMTFYILPALTHSNENIQKLADFIDYSEIDTGMFYYTDLEIVATGDLGIRSTFEHLDNFTGHHK